MPDEDVKMFDLEDLPHTYIRAQGADGKWGSFSFTELLADAQGQKEILKWFGQQMLSAAGAEPDGTVSADAAVNMARIREIIVGRMIKVAPPKE